MTPDYGRNDEGRMIDQFLVPRRVGYRRGLRARETHLSSVKPSDHTSKDGGVGGEILPEERWKRKISDMRTGRREERSG